MGLPNPLIDTYCNGKVELDTIVYTLIDTDRREVLDLIHMHDSTICNPLW